MAITHEITVTQAAELLGTYPRHVQRMIRRGQLPARKIDPRLPNSPYLLPRAAVLRLQKQRGQRAPSR